MYRRILIAVEHSPSDRTILTHVEELARLTHSELLLVHVADGVVARHFDDLQLRGIDLPILIRFAEILKHRLGEIHEAFQP